MPKYEVTIATPFYKTIIVEAPSPSAARSIIYNGPDVEALVTIAEGIGRERIVGPVLRVREPQAPASAHPETEPK